MYQNSEFPESQRTHFTHPGGEEISGKLTVRYGKSLNIRFLQLNPLFLWSLCSIAMLVYCRLIQASNASYRGTMILGYEI